jgi:hypothetical protein
LAAAEVEVLDIAGREQAVGLLAALAGRDLRYVYAVAGPGVLRTLVAADRLNRLYLTTVFRLLGGDAIATLLRGDALQPPPPGSDFARPISISPRTYPNRRS